MRLVQFIEIYEITKPGKESRTYSLREVFINPEQIVLVRENTSLKEKMQKLGWPQDLDERNEFCRLSLNLSSTAGATINIVGDLKTITNKIEVHDVHNVL